ncbi:MAG: FHA domain-containing protein [Anaerolineae bacterium]
MLKLVIRSGAQAGKEFPLDRPVVCIGRGSGSDILLQDSQASRQHAEISRQGDQFFIRDLGSMNGTFVNGERITGPRLLKPGDEIRIGETILASIPWAVAGAPARADWESELWTGQTAVEQTSGRRRLLLWGLAGVGVVLLAAIAVLAYVMLNRGKGTPTPAAQIVTATASPLIVIAPTATPTSPLTAEGEPMVTPLVQVPTIAAPTVAVQATVPTVKPPSPPKVPTSVPLSPGQLEQLPAIVQQYLGGVPADQLSTVIAAQLQNLAPDQVQVMIAALFPGVAAGKLPQVVAASFPELKPDEIQRLFGLAFPGQTFQIPSVTGPVGGRLVLGIYDKANDQHNLYVANASGGQPTLVTEMGSEPDFAPDGQWIVYFSWDPSHLGLRLIKVDGSGGTQLTNVREHGYPTFSPDGSRISFYHNVNDILHVINRDGTGMRDIGHGEYPAWSPVGDQIVYRGCVGSGRCGLIVANADGSNPRQITTHANDAAPRWSPNGGQIAFHSDRDGNWEIYVINVDGTWLRRVTINPTTDIMPVWSPDGLRIAFRSDRGGKGAVWVTSGIGGPAFKQFDAEFDPAYPELAQMDWAK